MKLIVGLGNPGKKYEETRHNIGFDVGRELARRFATGRARVKFQGDLCEAQIGTEAVLLLLPQTFMNRSGTSVLLARDFYKLADEEILVICDDFHLPLAKLRFRRRGTAGGQKGLADIIARLGSPEIARLRFGIGYPPAEWDVADYVLSRFRIDEFETLDAAVRHAATAAAHWVTDGIEDCMNRYNADPGSNKRADPGKKNDSGSNEKDNQ